MSIWRPFAAAMVLPLLFAALVLVDARLNRLNARAPIDLGNREVILSTGSEDNSGAVASLVWAPDQPLGQPWLSTGQLAALGFDTSVDPARSTADRHYARQLQRRAFVVLQLRDDRTSRSRLVPVDAAPDSRRLVAEYPDGRTHLVTSGIVGIRRYAFPGRAPYIDGYVATIDPQRIHIPSEFRERLVGASRRSSPFTLVLRYGSRLEPWVSDVR